MLETPPASPAPRLLAVLGGCRHPFWKAGGRQPSPPRPAQVRCGFSLWSGGGVHPSPPWGPAPPTAAQLVSPGCSSPGPIRVGEPAIGDVKLLCLRIDQEEGKAANRQAGGPSRTGASPPTSGSELAGPGLPVPVPVFPSRLGSAAAATAAGLMGRRRCGLSPRGGALHPGARRAALRVSVVQGAGGTTGGRPSLSARRTQALGARRGRPLLPGAARAGRLQGGGACEPGDPGRAPGNQAKNAAQAWCGTHPRRAQAVPAPLPGLPWL